MGDAQSSPGRGWVPFALAGLLAGGAGGWWLAAGPSGGESPAEPSGFELYLANCARCHGDRGQGVSPFRPLVGKARTLEEIEERIKRGGGAMPPFGFLSPAKQRAIAEYVLILGEGQ